MGLAYSTVELQIAAMQRLKVVALDFRFRARGPMRMPGYMGEAWRGGFGRALKRAICVTGLPTCPVARSSKAAFTLSVRDRPWRHGRQQALLRMGGLLGSLSLPLAGLEPLCPLLGLARWVHVGKGATMGLAAMRVVPA
jgi:hypothetical protein